MKKLSERQREVVDRMRNGWTLVLREWTSCRPQIYLAHRLVEIAVHVRTFNSLVREGVVVCAYRRDSMHQVFELTEEYRDAPST